MVVRRLVFSQFRRGRNGVALSNCIASLLCVVVSIVYYIGKIVVVYEPRFRTVYSRSLLGFFNTVVTDNVFVRTFPAVRDAYMRAACMFSRAPFDVPL